MAKFASAEQRRLYKQYRRWAEEIAEVRGAEDFDEPTFCVLKAETETFVTIDPGDRPGTFAIDAMANVAAGAEPEGRPDLMLYLLQHNLGVLGSPHFAVAEGSVWLRARYLDDGHGSKTVFLAMLQEMIAANTSEGAVIHERWGGMRVRSFGAATPEAPPEPARKPPRLRDLLEGEGGPGSW